MANQPKAGIAIKLNENTLKILLLMFVDDCIIFVELVPQQLEI